jgi:hypothetical protein
MNHLPKPVVDDEPRTIRQDESEGRVVRTNPAIRRSGWLPHGLWPELDDLADRHEEAIKRITAAYDEATALGKRFEDEDKQREEAYATGMVVPEMTDPGERQRAVTDARAKVRGAEKNLVTVCAEAIRTVQEKLPEWQASMRERAEEARQMEIDAMALLQEAQFRTVGLKRTAHWVSRTARNRPGDHIGHDSIPVEQPQPLPALVGLHGSEIAYLS